MEDNEWFVPTNLKNRLIGRKRTRLGVVLHEIIEEEYNLIINHYPNEVFILETLKSHLFLTLTQISPSQWCVSFFGWWLEGFRFRMNLVLLLSWFFITSRSNLGGACGRRYKALIVMETDIAMRSLLLVTLCFLLARAWEEVRYSGG